MSCKRAPQEVFTQTHTEQRPALLEQPRPRAQLSSGCWLTPSPLCSPTWSALVQEVQGTVSAGTQSGGRSSGFRHSPLPCQQCYSFSPSFRFGKIGPVTWLNSQREHRSMHACDQAALGSCRKGHVSVSPAAGMTSQHSAGQDRGEG